MSWQKYARIRKKEREKLLASTKGQRPGRDK